MLLISSLFPLSSDTSFHFQFFPPAASPHFAIAELLVKAARRFSEKKPKYVSNEWER